MRRTPGPTGAGAATPSRPRRSGSRGERAARSRHLGVLPRQRRRACRGRTHRRRGAGGAFHAPEADPSFPRARGRLLPRRGRDSRSTSSTPSCSTSKPDLKFARLVETYLAFAPRGWESFRRAAIRCGSREKLLADDPAADELGTLDSAISTRRSCCFAEHHVSHAASAFYPSPFEDAAILTIDGVGEWATTTVGARRGQRADDAEGAALPPLPRAALLRVHVLHGLQGQLRRVQGDGARALRRAEVRTD